MLPFLIYTLINNKMSVVGVNSASELQGVVAKAAKAGKLVVVDCFADWCGPCRQMAPVFAALASEFPDVVFVKFDTDQDKPGAGSLRISGLPTFLFFLKGSEADRLTGADSNGLRSRVQSLRQQASPAFGGSGQAMGGSAAASPDAMKAARLARLQKQAEAAKAAAPATSPSKRSRQEEPVPAPAPAKEAAPAPAPEEAAAAPPAEAAPEEATPAAAGAAGSGADAAEPEGAAAEEQEEEPPKAQEPDVDDSLVQALTEMGFSRAASVRATFFTGGQGLEQALEWVDQHADDQDLNTPLTIDPNAAEESDEARAAANKPPLTKAEKVAMIRAKIEAKKKAKAEAERKARKEREMIRRKEGQNFNKSREMLEATQREQRIKEREKARRLEARERFRVKRNMMRDKATKLADDGDSEGARALLRKLQEFEAHMRDPLSAAAQAALAAMSGNAAAAGGAGKPRKAIKDPDATLTRALQALKQYRAGGEGAKALKTIHLILNNALTKGASDPKYCRVNSQAKVLKAKVATFLGGLDCLRVGGFSLDDEDGYWKYDPSEEGAEERLRTTVQRVAEAKAELER